MLDQPSQPGAPGDWFHLGVLPRLTRRGSIWPQFWEMCELPLEYMEGEGLPEEAAQRSPGSDPPAPGPSSPV